MLIQSTGRQRLSEIMAESVTGGGLSHSNKSERYGTVLESNEAPIKFIAGKLQKIFYSDTKILNELRLIRNYKKFLKLTYFSTCLLFICYFMRV